MRAGGRNSAAGDWRGASGAGLSYTLCVFVIAFAVGAIRVTLVAPRLGTLLAVVLEAPVVLAASWVVSRWCTRRFNVGGEWRARVLMGAVAFSALMLLELTVAVVGFGETLDRYFSQLATTPGVVGLAMQVCFAAIPWVQSRSRTGRDSG